MPAHQGTIATMEEIAWQVTTVLEGQKTGFRAIQEHTKLLWGRDRPKIVLFVTRVSTPADQEPQQKESAVFVLPVRINLGWDHRLVWLAVLETTRVVLG